MDEGYLYIGGFKDDLHHVSLELEMKPRAVFADPRVSEDAQKIAFMRGPVVYCAEEKDNGKNLKSIVISRPVDIKEKTDSEFGFESVSLEVSAARRSFEGAEFFESTLYRDYSDVREDPVDLKLIPYALWANRGEGEMSVYFFIT